MPARKAIPPRTLQTLLPPNYDYEYFAGAATWRFRGEAIGFDPVNASWLADAALLAYADARFVRAQWLRAGAASVRLFEGASTVAHVADCGEGIIVAFRGTQVRKPGPRVDGENTWRDVLLDIATDLDFRPASWRNAGFVHRGFREALAQVWQETAESSSSGRSADEDLGQYLLGLARAAGGRRRIWFTGHSLGGALATLAAQRCQDAGLPAAAHTFGSPRVGDRRFAESYDVTLYRLVHGTDAVTRVPPVPYRHVGEVHALSSDAASAPQSVSARVGDRLWRSVPVACSFADHSPLYYAIGLWNRCVDAEGGAARQNITDAER